MFSNNGQLSRKQLRHMATVQCFSIGGLLCMLQYNKVGWQIFALLLAFSIAYGFIFPGNPYWSSMFRWVKIILFSLLPGVVVLGVHVFILQKRMLPERNVLLLLIPLGILCGMGGKQTAEARGRLFELLYFYLWIFFVLATCVFLGKWGNKKAICNTLFDLAMVVSVFAYVSQCIYRLVQLGGRANEI